MQKLNKPGIGLNECRKLTRKESAITGLSRSVVIMTDNVGSVKFYRSTYTGLSSYIVGQQARDKEIMLTDFWNENKIKVFGRICR
ncbi:hypothetical protein LCGC14_0864250 [marine sediment metagenome]|uniref:Uncharacterized protein n=1 Tax=marine sediment metagenome TaxID=412755 RepID=A0A0F9PBH2_9ZZZZ